MWRRYGRIRNDRKIVKKLAGNDIFLTVQQMLRNEIAIPRQRWSRRTDLNFLNSFIEDARSRLSLTATSGDSVSAASMWLLLLTLQAPGAALAQEQMDEHPHGYHNKEKRLYELIDFNDSFVSTVLALPEGSYATFPEHCKHLFDWFCKRLGTRCFSNEQYEAIVHGLSHEVAVYLAVKTAGYYVEMTNRTADAFGIDMFISDPDTGRKVAVDTKTNSAFHYRLIELLKEGRLSDADLELAERRGFMGVFNGRDEDRRRVVLWRIDHETLGYITDFQFANTTKLTDELRNIISEYGE